MDYVEFDCITFDHLKNDRKTLCLCNYYVGRARQAPQGRPERFFEQEPSVWTKFGPVTLFGNEIPEESSRDWSQRRRKERWDEANEGTPGKACSSRYGREVCRGLSTYRSNNWRFANPGTRMLQHPAPCRAVLKGRSQRYESEMRYIPHQRKESRGRSLDRAKLQPYLETIKLAFVANGNRESSVVLAKKYEHLTSDVSLRGIESRALESTPRPAYIHGLQHTPQRNLYRTTSKPGISEGRFGLLVMYFCDGIGRSVVGAGHSDHRTCRSHARTSLAGPSGLWIRAVAPRGLAREVVTQLINTVLSSPSRRKRSLRDDGAAPVGACGGWGISSSRDAHNARTHRARARAVDAGDAAGDDDGSDSGASEARIGENSARGGKPYADEERVRQMRGRGAGNWLVPNDTTRAQLFEAQHFVLDLRPGRAREYERPQADAPQRISVE
ncbi:hypothetical protein C8R45DRAFT_921699 [Mycena sanguinolenta]|nr:hypothetical protein C8R45DRAFT_921699 [Mycena sanguinolenta]